MPHWRASGRVHVTRRSWVQIPPCAWLFILISSVMFLFKGGTAKLFSCAAWGETSLIITVLDCKKMPQWLSLAVDK